MYFISIDCGCDCAASVATAASVYKKNWIKAFPTNFYMEISTVCVCVCGRGCVSVCSFLLPTISSSSVCRRQQQKGQPRSCGCLWRSASFQIGIESLLLLLFNALADDPACALPLPALPLAGTQQPMPLLLCLGFVYAKLPAPAPSLSLSLSLAVSVLRLTQHTHTHT